MAKKDLSEDLQSLYFPSAKEPVMVDVPEMQYLMVDGTGNPNDSVAFKEAIGALYGVAYTAKFTAKFTGGGKIQVMPLEALWWGDQEDFLKARKDSWQWRLLLMMPPAVTQERFNDAVRQLRAKKNPPGLDRVRLETWREGLAAQILYVGPYAEETATIERLHAYIRGQGLRPAGKHHEIYIGDPNRSKPEKLKTVIRAPASR